MIELHNDRLRFSFAEVHPAACLEIDFQRTLRIPDDGRDYPLPPGLGPFPLCHVDDFADRIPAAWSEHGGVMLPLYQGEALWLRFEGPLDPMRMVSYPWAIRVATGKIDAVTGRSWMVGLERDPQNYLVHPGQPWLDGYSVERGVIRQFVAMPLGAGYTVEEQLTGRADHGGLQLQAFPMKREVFERRFPLRPAWAWSAPRLDMTGAAFCVGSVDSMAMGLAPGGRMRQEVYADRFDLSDWDTSVTARCFIHLANTLVWRAVTGQAPPTRPPTARDYTRAGLPWFEYYDEGRTPVVGSRLLRGLRSVLGMAKEKGAPPLLEDVPVVPERVIRLRDGERVREGVF